MSRTPNLPSFLTDESVHVIIWCYTGGGHFFKENYQVIKDLISNSVPLCVIFSQAGAMVANRYGFFWDLKSIPLNYKSTIFLFSGLDVMKYNVQRILEEAKLPYSVIEPDPAFSMAISLANRRNTTIIISPMTSNTVAKVVNGICDTFITNLICGRLKSGKRIIGVPTDGLEQIILTNLPVRMIQLDKSQVINIDICKYGALKQEPRTKVSFDPKYCVGCKECEQMYPESFVSGEKLSLKIRKIDISNLKRLSREMKILKSPLEVKNTLEGT